MIVTKFHQIYKRLIFGAHTLHLEGSMHHTNETNLGPIHIQIHRAKFGSSHAESTVRHEIVGLLNAKPNEWGSTAGRGAGAENAELPQEQSMAGR